MSRGFRFRHRKSGRMNPIQLLESTMDYLDNYVDPRDALVDDESGELWKVIGQGGAYSAYEKVNVSTEQDLAEVRKYCRDLAASNPFAINGHENRISYIVGSGHAYTVAAKNGQEVATETLDAIQEIIDAFLKANRWNFRQQETVRRLDRDGEVFRRIFSTSDGIKVRFVEPDQIVTPADKANDSASSWGIKTDADDVETVLGYYIDGKMVNADQIQHLKANVDSNVKRGMPLFAPVRRNLRRAEKLLRNMSVVAEIQAAIALIRKHQGGATAADIANMVTGNADATVMNQTRGTTQNFRRYAPGTIIDANQGVDYEFPAQGIDASRYVTVLQAELRSIASRLVMPEFMLTSDASNANYSSTMVAEGPAVKMFQRLQYGIIEADMEVLDRVLDVAVERGQIDAATREAIKIDVTPPTLAARDRAAEVNADMALVNGRIMSIHTCQLKNDLDPETESEWLEKEQEEADKRNPFNGLGEFGMMPPDGEEEDGNKEKGEEEEEDGEKKQPPNNSEDK